MFDLPVLQKIVAESINDVTLQVLKARFGTVPGGVVKRLQNIRDREKVAELGVLAAQCPDLKTFREALRA